MIPWAELRALGGFVLLVMAVDLIAFAAMLVKSL